MSDSITDTDLRRWREEYGVNTANVKTVDDLKSEFKSMSGGVMKNEFWESNNNKLAKIAGVLIERSVYLDDVIDNWRASIDFESTDGYDLIKKERSLSDAPDGVRGDLSGEFDTAFETLVSDNVSLIEEELQNLKITEDTKITKATVDVVISRIANIPVSKAKEHRDLIKIP